MQVLPVNPPIEDRPQHSDRAISTLAFPLRDRAISTVVFPPQLSCNTDSNSLPQATDGLTSPRVTTSGGWAATMTFELEPPPADGPISTLPCTRGRRGSSIECFVLYESMKMCG
jgi:hypothetical protein